jgi:hypothetical protein
MGGISTPIEGPPKAIIKEKTFISCVSPKVAHRNLLASPCISCIYVHSQSIYGIQDCTLRHIQGDRKVMQTILQYLLMVAIQYNSTGLINTQCHCDYTRDHAGHVIL